MTTSDSIRAKIDFKVNLEFLHVKAEVRDQNWGPRRTGWVRTGSMMGVLNSMCDFLKGTNP